jgi:hypothetical protein
MGSETTEGPPSTRKSRKEKEVNKPTREEEE